MRFRVFACDFDGTLATEGVVGRTVVDALRRVRDSGRRLVLVTGRTRVQLDPAPAGLELFDALVLENGALLVDPATGEETPLGPPVSERLPALLSDRGVRPVHVGRAICATHARFAATMRAAIDELALPMDTVFNQDSLVALPAGVSKATGTREALRRSGEHMSACVAVGNAENDVALLAAAGCGVAVAGSPPELRAVADLVLRLPDGAGLVEIAEALVGDDLSTRLGAGPVLR
ncbi:MAG: HAD hydrolase family protein [Candidatus Dormiibacterota bacterium]